MFSRFQSKATATGLIGALGAAAAGLFASSGPAAAASDSASGPQRAICVLKPYGKKSKVEGTVTFSQHQPGDPTIITAEVFGLPLNDTKHGFQIHEFGNISQVAHPEPPLPSTPLARLGVAVLALA